MLRQIGDKHRVSIANAGVRYIPERPAVAGVILGTRIGVAQHLDDNARVFGFATDGEDEAKIETVLATSRNLSDDWQLRRRISLISLGKRIYCDAHFTRTERDERPSFVWVQ